MENLLTTLLGLGLGLWALGSIVWSAAYGFWALGKDKPMLRRPTTKEVLRAAAAGKPTGLPYRGKPL